MKFIWMDSYEWELSKNHMIEILARGQPKKKKKTKKIKKWRKKIVEFLISNFEKKKD